MLDALPFNLFNSFLLFAGYFHGFKLYFSMYINLNEMHMLNSSAPLTQLTFFKWRRLSNARRKFKKIMMKKLCIKSVSQEFFIF